jgi:hypothetical protein
MSTWIHEEPHVKVMVTKTSQVFLLTFPAAIVRAYASHRNAKDVRLFCAACKLPVQEIF